MFLISHSSCTITCPSNLKKYYVRWVNTAAIYYVFDSVCLEIRVGVEAQTHSGITKTQSVGLSEGANPVWNDSNSKEEYERMSKHTQD